MNIKITRPNAPVKITLDMTAREAMVLRSIMRNIAGTIHGPRSVADQLEHALREQGINYYESGISGSIYFPRHWADLHDSEDGD